MTTEEQKRNVLYAQSGGVTAVINASACGVIETARKHKETFGRIFAGENGILGVLDERLIDTSVESADAIASLRHTPGGAFGSCRFKMGSPKQKPALYQRLLEVFKAHNIGYFFYNGGGDSQDTTNQLAKYCEQNNFPLTCIGIPKTIDNDLPITDSCPGFGSVAKYVATSVMEASLDVASMAKTSTKVFILEVMGRHAGWIAASGALAARKPGDPPHIILFPERPFLKSEFTKKVKECVNLYGFCSIAVSEGIRNADGNFVSEQGIKDAFGHAQLGGVAPNIANIIRSELGFKYHWAVADYLQRSARHLASKTDVEHAYEVGAAAVSYAKNGKNAIMPIIIRTQDNPYKWAIGETPLNKVANIEKTLPPNFISKDGFGVTEECIQYLRPLIGGEDYPPYVDGVPNYVSLKKQFEPRKLTDDFAIE
tara:strand:- start:86 stop:1363 length:1278 start_codon:yes stop_codon:yes gene_type:complete